MIELTKGGNINLSKEAPGLKSVTIGLGWDVRKTDGAAFDLDASAFMLKADGKVRGTDDVIYYRKLSSNCGSVRHHGDNLTGAGDGDDERITIDLSKVPADIDKIAITVTIYDAEARKQNFGGVQKAYVSVTNDDGGVKLSNYDLSEDMSTETAMIFAEIYRHGTEWKFKAIGQGYKGGLGALAANYGA